MKNLRSQAGQYYVDNHAELVKQHKGKYIAIKGEEVLGVFENYGEADRSVYPEHKFGSVYIGLVQEQEPEPYYRYGYYRMIE